MRGVRFYQDENGCGIKRRGWKKLFPNGCNGIAVFYENRIPGEPAYECASAVFAGAGDGPYAGSSTSFDYISDNCRRISEVEARKLFPNLISYLEL